MSVLHGGCNMCEAVANNCGYGEGDDVTLVSCHTRVHDVTGELPVLYLSFSEPL